MAPYSVGEGDGACCEPERRDRFFITSRSLGSRCLDTVATQKHTVVLKDQRISVSRSREPEYGHAVTRTFVRVSEPPLLQ
jgi:hypothetical protein